MRVLIWIWSWNTKPCNPQKVMNVAERERGREKGSLG